MKRDSYSKSWGILHLGIGIFIIISSFLYGLVQGLSNKGPKAYAALDTGRPFLSTGTENYGFPLPAGLVLTPLGNEVTINDKSAVVFSFVTERGVKNILSELVGKWERIGALTVGVATRKRGFAVGFNSKLAKRFSISAWAVPLSIRAVYSGGKPVQGLITVIDTAGEEGASGQVPGIPIRTAGKGGAVYSSLDTGGRSYSGVYTNPGTVSDNIEYYREELISSGWRERGMDITQSPELGLAVGNLNMVQGNEEIVLLFSPVKGDEVHPDGESKTVVVVTRGARQAMFESSL